MISYASCVKNNVNFCLYFLLFGLTNVWQNSVSGVILPLWSWECINEKCLARKTTHMSKLQSLETCNMLCSSMQIWPQPTGPVSLSTTAVPVRADLFQIHTLKTPSKSVHDHIQAVFRLFYEDLSKIERRSRGFEEWRSVALRIVVNNSVDPRMRLNTDESYSLSVRPVPGTALIIMADIMASTFCGARHALETLSQLVWLDTHIGSLLMLEAARVDDAPRYRYRGILVDTAREFFPVEELMLNIDAMGANKLNTFHWHMSDSQAFPLHSNHIPQLAQYGAHSSDNVYTPDEVREVVRRARLRGIRVLIEIDSPAHVGYAWTFGNLTNLSDMVYCLESEPWDTYCSEPPCGQLNPYNKHIFAMLARLYSEIIQITGVDDMFHLGGDEISQKCYRDYHPEADPMDLWIQYTKSLLNSLEMDTLRGKKPNFTIFWASSLTARMRTDFQKYIKNIGIQIRNIADLQNTLSNVRTIISDDDAWDFNTGHGAWYEESGGAFYNSWQRVYDHRPWLKYSLGIIEGGEATVWASEIAEGSLLPRVWPRAAALAERLWTDSAEGATTPVHARFDVHRSRLVSRGIPAGPLWSMWCTQHTYTCKF